MFTLSYESTVLLMTDIILVIFLLYDIAHDESIKFGCVVEHVFAFTAVI